MEVDKGLPTAKCTLAEFFEEYFERNATAPAKHTLTDALMGQLDVRPKHKIRSGDHDLLFSYKELLLRFTTLSTEAQLKIVCAVEAACSKLGVSVLEITIPWSPKSTRKLQIRKDGTSFHFELI